VKKFFALGAATAALGFIASANAADMQTKAPMYTKAPVATPGFSWTGCYAGIEGGGIWGKTTHVATNGAGAGFTQFTTNVDGGTIGGTIGCNYQTSNWVVGIENDFAWAGIDGSSNHSPPFATGIIGHTTTTWLDTLRARVGYAADRWLWYATGGVAFSDIKGSAEVPGFVPLVTITNDRVGWVIGAGVEWAAFADPHLSVKAEYLYADFGKKDYDFGTLSGGVYANATVRLTESIGRVGLNYRFW
jgi:outer membrane immunogenic protein